MPTAERVGHWMQLASGGVFWPLDPTPEEIYLEDIAHSLSQQCRFAGHSRFHYSVAQHSVYVSQLCDPNDALWGLLHDASETYLVDVPKPIKSHLTNYEGIEENIQKTIAMKFGLPWPVPQSVKHADMVMCVTEKRDVIPPAPIEWQFYRDINPSDTIRIVQWTICQAKNEFFKRFHELTGGL